MTTRLAFNRAASSAYGYIHTHTSRQFANVKTTASATEGTRCLFKHKKAQGSTDFLFCFFLERPNGTD